MTKTTEGEYNIKDYRAAIRSLWLPIVARKKLNGAEMRFILGLWERGEPIELVLRAIEAIDERRRSTTLVVHSLGIIRSDIEALKITRRRMRVGDGSNQKPTDDGAWRAAYAEDLEDLAEGIGSPSIAAQYRELKRDLPGIASKQAADARFRRIR